MKVMDINDIKANAGVVFNKQDPRFESVVENYINNNKKRLLNGIKDSPYYLPFENIIGQLANCCFFVQKEEKMYACGIENCSIDVFCEKDNIIHCALNASFHLYSTECGFYRVGATTVIMKTFTKKELQNDLSVRVPSDRYYPFSALFIEKEGSFENIRWKNVYEKNELNKILFKSFRFECKDTPVHHIEVAENDRIIFSYKNVKPVYTLSKSSTLVAYETNENNSNNICFWNFREKHIDFCVPNKGFYKIFLAENQDSGEYQYKVKLREFSKNPLMLLSLKELYNLYKTLIGKAKEEEFYCLDKIKECKQDCFEFIFEEQFNIKSDVAISIACKSESFKRLSTGKYYTVFNKKDSENIELLFFTLRQKNLVFDDAVITYLDNVSLLRKIENFLNFWKEMILNENLYKYGFGAAFTRKEFDFFEREYQKLYKKQILHKQKEIYNAAIARGVHFGKWKSEQRMYALVVKYFNDAIYQYHDKWLGLQSLDVYIPSLKIAFEYQGEQHYNATDFFGGEEKFKIRQERDARKRALCLENGITLIEWKYDEKITKENLATKLKPFINELPEENLNYTWEDEKLKLAFAKEAKEKESLKPKIPTKVLVQYDIDGNYINYFISQEEASQKTGASKGTISFVINGRQKTSGGYVWRYFDADKIPEKIEKTEITTPEAKEVIQLDLAGNIIKTFPSIKSASKICGICTKNIRNVINGKQKTAGGYKWKLKE